MRNVRLSAPMFALLAGIAAAAPPSSDEERPPREDPLPPPPPPIGRSCGPCTLCCKTYANHELQKPENTWCTHARKKAGCAIHPTRPVECQAFSCAWMMGMLPESCRPDKIGVVLDIMPSDLQSAFLHPIMRESRTILFLRVTQDYAGVWRRPETYRVLKWLIGQQAPSGHVVLLMIQGRDSWTLWDGEQELNFHPFQHELGMFWVPDGKDAEAKERLDAHLADPDFMGAMRESNAILSEFSEGERAQAAQLGDLGVVFIEPHRAEKMRRYAAFLRKRMPDRKFEVKVMPMPPGWEQFSTEREAK